MNNSSKKIGLMDETVTELRGGPKVFMNRLKDKLIERKQFDNDQFDVWINLSFREIPKFVKERQNEVDIVIRFDGIWNMKVIPEKFRVLPQRAKGKLNHIIFRYLNRTLLTNYQLADKVIYQSEFSKFQVEKLLTSKYKPKKSIIIYNGIDINKFKPQYELRDQKKNFPNVLVSHRMVPLKRAHQIPSIIELLKDDYPNIKVHMVGEGVKNPFYFYKDSMDYIKNEISKRNLEKYFEFHGHIKPDNLPDVYNRCDFMLNLSFADPCPNVVIEAMACGLPVVGPRSGGLAELVKYDDLLVDENTEYFPSWTSWIYNELPQIDPLKYAEKCNFVINNLTQLSSRTRKRVENNFDINKVVEDYVSFVTSV